MSIKASDYSCVPLCSDCHKRRPLADHRIEKRAFERVHGVRFASVASAGGANTHVDYTLDVQRITRYPQDVIRSFSSKKPNNCFAGSTSEIS